MLLLVKGRLFRKRNYYEILGVNRDASDEEIRAAFVRRSQQVRPHLNPLKSKFLSIFASVLVLRFLLPYYRGWGNVMQMVEFFGKECLSRDAVVISFNIIA